MRLGSGWDLVGDATKKVLSKNRRKRSEGGRNHRPWLGVSVCVCTHRCEQLINSFQLTASQTANVSIKMTLVVIFHEGLQLVLVS